MFFYQNPLTTQKEHDIMDSLRAATKPGGGEAKEDEKKPARVAARAGPAEGLPPRCKRNPPNKGLTCPIVAANRAAVKEVTNMTNIYTLTNAIEARNPRSAWEKGVKAYALDLLDEWDADEPNICPRTLERTLLNGAATWQQYSWAGSALCYDQDIAERLCAPWELRKTDGGRKRPNPREEWLDVQARALYQAARLIAKTARELTREEGQA